MTSLADALAHVSGLTGLTGRWQVICPAPLTICDTGHNVGGWKYLSQQIAQVECDNRHIIFGMVDDKDIQHVLELLPKDAHYYFTQADTKRALNGTIVKTFAAQHGLYGESYPSVVEAYRAAKEANFLH